MQRGARLEGVSSTGSEDLPCHFIFNSCPLPSHTWCDSKVTLDVQKPPPRVVKAASLIIHSPLLSIRFYHMQLSFLAPQTFLFHSALVLDCPSIPFVVFLSTSHTSHRILLRIVFANWSSSILSMCSNHFNILCSAQPASPSHFLISHLVYTYYFINW